jgi:hypothetical protein
MRIGFLADIHGHLPNLDAVLAKLATRGCDTIVQLGDTVNAGHDPSEVITRLLDAGVTNGVWGNHDFGLMHNPPADLLNQFPVPIRDFLTSQRPDLRFTHGDRSVFASHIDPDLDPHEHDQLWNRRRPPKSPHDIAQIFRSRPETYLITAHRHRWFAATEAGPVSFARRMELDLVDQRWLIVLDAVKNGWAAVLDLERRVLERIRGRVPGPGRA